MKKSGKAKQIGLLSLITGLGLGLAAQAATITWDTAATDIVDESNASTNGNSIWAYNLGTAATETDTINGVTFVGMTTAASAGLATTGIPSVTGNAYRNNVAGSAFLGLSEDYQDILESGNYDGSGTATLTLTELSSGQEYEVQFWLNDARNRADMDTIPRTATIFGTGIVVDYNTAGASTNGGLGQCISGTFTADAETQSFDLDSAALQLNAIQLRLLSDATLLLVNPSELDLVLSAPETMTTGSIDVAYVGSPESVDINVSFEGTHASAFSVIPPASFTLNDPSPSNSTVEIVFDNGTAGLVHGESATGLVNIVWNETGNSVFATNAVPMSVLYVDDPAAKIFYSTGSGSGQYWNNAIWTNNVFTTAEIPSAGNTYIHNESGQIRAYGSSVFLGDSLELRATGAILGLKVTPVDVNLIMNAGTEVANYGGGGVMNGSLSSSPTNGTGSILFSSAWNNRFVTLNGPVTIGPEITGIVVDLGNYTGSVSTESMTINSSSNTFAGTWDVQFGTLVGGGEESLGASSFNVQENGILDFNYGYSNDTQTLTVESGGLLLLDQNVVIGAATFWGETLADGTYSGADLKANGIYGSAIHSNSLDTAILFVGGYVAPIKEIGSVQLSVAGGEMVIGVSNTVDSASYTVWMKHDLVYDVAWSNLVVVPGSNGMMNITLPTTDPEAFYKVSGE